MYQNRLRGFTLIELMIVVAIIAIISAVAYPTYVSFMMKGRRADGRELLQRIGVAEERYYTNNNRYTNNLTLLLSSPLSEQGYYRAQNPVVDATGQTFVVTATPLAAQTNDKCAGLTLNNLGVKGFTGAETNGRCW
jgi:type IV pilus assembly protein PilE